MQLRRLAALLSLAALPLVPTSPAAADSTDVRRELAVVTARLQQAEQREGEALDHVTRVRRSIAKMQQEQRAVSGRLAGRVRAAYMSGLGGDSIEVLLTSENPFAAVQRLGLVAAVTRHDAGLMLRGRVLARQLAQQRAEVAEAATAARQARTSLAADAKRLEQLFEVLAAREQAEAERRAEAARQARARRLATERVARQRALALAAQRRLDRAARSRAAAAVPVGAGGYACLVGPAHSFADTYGAPLSGGRRHQGVDVFAPRNSPVYAVTSGVIQRSGTNRLGGIVLYLRGDDGVEYYYAHMAVSLVRSGDRVAAGELVARVGTTGNAEGTSPHVHFEVHPGGGAAVNPTPFAHSVCG